MIEKKLRKLLKAEFEVIPPKEELKRMYLFSERHNRKMERILKTELKSEKASKCFSMLRKAAIVALTLMGSAVVTLKIIPTVYAYVEKWIVESANDRVIFKDNNGSVNGEAAALRFEPQYVPEGYEFVEETYGMFGSIIITYQNSAGERLRFEYGRLNGKQLSADIENALLTEKSVNGVEYYVFENAEKAVTVAWEHSGYLLCVHGTLEMPQMIDIAVAVKGVEDK